MHNFGPPELIDTLPRYPRVNFVHTLTRAIDYQDRPEYAELCKWWRQGGGGVCALVGIGGAGKTALAERILRVLPGVLAAEPLIPKDPTLPVPEALFLFSFYQVPNPQVFFAQLSTWLRGESADQSARPLSYYETLALLQGTSSLLLVLDGLEKVQDDGTRGGFLGRIEDGAVRDFLLRVAEGSLPGISVLVTPRFLLDDMQYVQSPNYYTIPVEKLAPKSCIALLRKRGVRGVDSALGRIAAACGHHALTVDLAGGYITYFGKGDPQTPLHLPTPRELKQMIERTPDRRLRYVVEQSARFARLAEQYRQALATRDPAAVALLERICLFRLGVTANLLASIFTGKGKAKISGSALAALRPEALSDKLNVLAEMRLVEWSGDRTVAIHPAIRDGFFRGLSATAARRGHEAIFEALWGVLGVRPHFFNIPFDELPPMLDTLEEIVHHTIAMGAAQVAFQIFTHNLGGYRNLGDHLGAYERGERICRAFVGGHHPEVAPTPKGLSEGAAAALFEQWGLFLKALGQLMAAICCFERSIEMRTRLKRWDDAWTCTLHLGETLLVAGRLAAGLEAGKKAFVLADREDGPSPYLTPPIYRYGLRAHVLALRGEVGAARDDFRAALDRENRIKRGKILRLPPIPRSTLSLPRPAPSKRRLDTTGVGVPYLRFLTRLGKTREARRLAEQYKQVLQSDWGMHASYVLHCNLLLVDLLREARDLDEAYHLLQQTSDMALARDERELLCCVALAQARRCANRMQGDLDNTETPEEISSLREAMTSVEEGLRLASAYGYSLYHIDLLTVGAWILLLQGDADSAERYARVALFGVEAPASDNSFHDATALDESAPPERRGAFPPQESGWPELLAATHPACGYVWGETAARHRLAESLLLRAARTLGRARYTPTEIDMLSAEVRSLLDTARSELAMCLTLRRHKPA